MKKETEVIIEIWIVDLKPNGLQDNAQNEFNECNNIPSFGVRSKPILNIPMNGKYVGMEVDTGPTVSCISCGAFNKLGLTGHVLSSCNVCRKWANCKIA